MTASKCIGSAPFLSRAAIFDFLSKLSMSAAKILVLSFTTSSNYGEAICSDPSEAPDLIRQERTGEQKEREKRIDTPTDSPSLALVHSTLPPSPYPGELSTR